MCIHTFCVFPNKVDNRRFEIVTYFSFKLTIQIKHINYQRYHIRGHSNINNSEKLQGTS
jgi:hypothetical protein